MKKILVRTLVVATAAAFLNTSYVLADDQQTPATPGSAAATDSKAKVTLPADESSQATLHPKEGSKNKKSLASAKSCSVKSKSDDSNVTASGAGAKATKTPQVSMPPSTPNNQ